MAALNLLRLFDILTSFTFWLIVLGVLFGCLGVGVWIRQRQVARAEEARLRAIEQEFGTRAFDPSVIAPGVEGVRQDFAASARRHSRSVHQRSEKVSAARRLVRRLGYFWRRDADEAHKNEAS